MVIDPREHYETCGNFFCEQSKMHTRDKAVGLGGCNVLMNVCEKILYFSISITFLDERVPGFFRASSSFDFPLFCFVFLSLTWHPGCQNYLVVCLSVSEFTV